jgi:hypothetical protein
VGGAACDEHEVTFLGTDIDHDGGKIILVAEYRDDDDEERMPSTVRRIATGRTSSRLHRRAPGPIFAGDVGPTYRRTYTVMGNR